MTKSLQLVQQFTQQFIPDCPICHRNMNPVKGQKKGAWRCPKCKGEFWDKIKSTEPDISDPTVELHAVHSNYTPGCPRCHLTMKLFDEDAWHCEQCNGQFWANAAPELEKIHDQLIHSTTNDIMRPDGGFKMLMSAKHKGSGSRKGRSRKKPRKLHKVYWYDDTRRKGA